METLESKSSIESLKASRAFGAMIFAFFGGAWMVLWAFRRSQNRGAALAVIAAGSVVIFLYALRRYRQHQAALAAEAESPAKKRAARLFNIINAAQWILILIVGNVPVNLGLRTGSFPPAFSLSDYTSCPWHAFFPIPHTM